MLFMFFNKQKHQEKIEIAKQKREKIIEIDNLKQIIKTNQEDLEIKRLNKIIKQQNKPFKTLNQEIKSEYNKTAYLNRLEKKEKLTKQTESNNQTQNKSNNQHNFTSFENVLLPETSSHSLGEDLS